MITAYVPKPTEEIFFSEDLIDRKALLFQVQPVFVRRVEVDSEGKTTVHFSETKAVLANDIVNAQTTSYGKTVCGYDVEELVRFAQIMRTLGVNEHDIKNFLCDTELVYKVLSNKLHEEFQHIIYNALYNDMRGEEDAAD